MTLRVVGEDGCARLHDATLTLLERTGVEMRHEGARDRCARAGARVEGTRVRLPRALVAEALASAARTWRLAPRGGETAPLELVAGAGPFYGTGPDCMYVRDADTGERRRGASRRRRRRRGARRAAPQRRLRDVHGAARGRRPRRARHDAVRRDAGRHAQAHRRLEPLRRRAPARHARDGGRLRRGRQPRLPRHDLAAADARRRLLRQGDHLRASSAYRWSSPARHPRARRRRRRCPPCVLVANAELLAGLVVHQLAAPGACFVYGSGVGAINLRTFVDVYGAPGVFRGRPGDAGPGDLVRAAELVLRGPFGQQAARRAVGAGDGHLHDHRVAFAGHTPARRGLPRGRPAERARGAWCSATSSPATPAPSSTAFPSTTHHSPSTRSTPSARAATTSRGA